MTACLMTPPAKMAAALLYDRQSMTSSRRPCRASIKPARGAIGQSDSVALRVHLSDSGHWISELVRYLDFYNTFRTHIGLEQKIPDRVYFNALPWPRAV